MPSPTITIAPDLAAAAVSHVASLSAVAIGARGEFRVAVSGGSMPKQLAGLVDLPLPERPDFSKWRVFFCDERCVPHDHPDSSFLACDAALFAAAGLSAASGTVFAIDPASAGDAAAAALAYEGALRSVFGADVSPSNPPVFDAVLLGMGPDGHTASLFPGHALLGETASLVAPITDSPKPPASRITLTLPVLNAARAAVFITGGAAKADALAAIFDPAVADADRLPAGRVRGDVTWLLDAAAGAGVPAS